MWRYLVGMLAGVLLVGGGVLLWGGGTGPHRARLAALGNMAAAANIEDVPEPPAASEKTREEKRFSRYDHDKDGNVSRDEFLAARHKAFAKLDTNSDGRLDFDEYAIKTTKRFADADADHDGKLVAAEFAATKIARKTRPRTACAPDAAPREAVDDT
ncbi:EF-hand domain-containing protein [Sphingomonas nostoxanthinifaciens]|uniref:histidine kinase n=1 Tax=Sphingomonas nostoxanthinifaciens TaxID=2872652 RepID=UPI001CC1E7EA|nr:histidine kinase [Sphingomonas nostoxanthinifaciens]UAK25334.1 histidine kinase [Sphingomonas nostoxanthinifaciens]